VLEATGGGANVLDSPLLAFAHLTQILSKQSRFEPMQAGEIVTTGTLTAALPVAPGQTWNTTFDGINLPGLSITLVAEHESRRPAELGTGFGTGLSGSSCTQADGSGAETPLP